MECRSPQLDLVSRPSLLPLLEGLGSHWWPPLPAGCHSSLLAALPDWRPPWAAISTAPTEQNDSSAHLQSILHFQPAQLPDQWNKQIAVACQWGWCWSSGVFHGSEAVLNFNTLMGSIMHLDISVALQLLRRYNAACHIFDFAIAAEPFLAFLEIITFLQGLSIFATPTNEWGRGEAWDLGDTSRMSGSFQPPGPA